MRVGKQIRRWFDGRGERQQASVEMTLAGRLERETAARALFLAAADEYDPYQWLLEKDLKNRTLDPSEALPQLLVDKVREEFTRIDVISGVDDGAAHAERRDVAISAVVERYNARIQKMREQLGVASISAGGVPREGERVPAAAKEQAA